MKARPVGFDDSDVVRALADGWGIDASADYAAVGFGSFHWVATSRDGQRIFVTVDDLGDKVWLGDTAQVAFAGLRKAFDVVVTLRDRTGLDFVLAPLPSIDGESVRRVGQRHSIASTGGKPNPSVREGNSRACAPSYSARSAASLQLPAKTALAGGRRPAASSAVRSGPMITRRRGGQPCPAA